MKRLAALFIAFLALGVMVYTAPVAYAVNEEEVAEALEEPSVARFYKLGDIITDWLRTVTGYDRLNNVFAQFTDSFVWLATNLFGVNSLVPEIALLEANPQLYAQLKEQLPTYAQRGLLPMAFDTVSYLFKEPWQVSPTQFYVQNFVPRPVKEVISNVTSDRAYAGYKPLVVGDPPTGTNAYDSLKIVVGPLWLSVFKLATGLFVIFLMISGLLIILGQKIKGQTPITVMIVLRNFLIGYVGAFFSFGLAVLFFNLSKFMIMVQTNLILDMYKGVVGSNTLDQPLKYSGKLFSQLADPNKGGDKLGGVIIFPGSLISLTDFVFDRAVGTIWQTSGAGFSQWWRNTSTGAKLGTIVGVMVAAASGFLSPLAPVLSGALMAGAAKLGLLGPETGTLVSAALIGMFGLVVAVFYGIAALFSAIRLFVFLIRILLLMVIDTVLAPLVFLFGVLPGQESNITNWFKRMFVRALSPALAYFLVNLGVAMFVVPVLLYMKGQIGADQLFNLDHMTGGVIPSYFTGATGTIVAVLNVPAIILLVMLNMAAGADSILSEMFALQPGAAGKLAGAAIQKIPIIGKYAGQG